MGRTVVCTRIGASSAASSITKLRGDDKRRCEAIRQLHTQRREIDSRLDSSAVVHQVCVALLANADPPLSDSQRRILHDRTADLSVRGDVSLWAPLQSRELTLSREFVANLMNRWKVPLLTRSLSDNDWRDAFDMSPSYRAEPFAVRAKKTLGHASTLQGPWQVCFPEMGSFLTWSESHPHRAIVHNAGHCLPHSNEPVIAELLSLRRLRASMLRDFDSYAHLQLTDSMLKTPKQVEQFLERMRQIVQPLAIQEHKALTEYAREQMHDSTLELKDCDIVYYAAYQRERLFPTAGLDPKARMFPLGRVLFGLRALISTLFDV